MKVHVLVVKVFGWPLVKLVRYVLTERITPAQRLHQELTLALSFPLALYNETSGGEPVSRTMSNREVRIRYLSMWTTLSHIETIELNMAVNQVIIRLILYDGVLRQWSLDSYLCQSPKLNENLRHLITDLRNHLREPQPA